MIAEIRAPTVTRGPPLEASIQRHMPFWHTGAFPATGAYANTMGPEMLVPLSYHREVVDYLRAAEPEVWAWANSLGVQEKHAQEIRANLLRETYRLSPEGHPQAYALCDAARQRLGLDVPVTLYQAGDGAMNAMLYFLSGEAHVVLKGPVLERLNTGETMALFGHELAHYRLWTLEDGIFHTADRILDHVLATHGSSPSHLETARLYALYTEIFADRGAAIAALAVEPAIATLVKVQTGLARVDAPSYLEQAREIEAAGARASAGTSHPEAYLRAQAVAKWWNGEVGTEAWMRARLQGPRSMDALDLPGQVALRDLTRRFIARFVANEPLHGNERVLAQVRAFFPDWGADEPRAELEEVSPERVDDSVLVYLHHVMLDLALADDDIREQALLEAGRTAAATDSLDALLLALRRDAGMPRREVDKFARRVKSAA